MSGPYTSAPSLPEDDWQRIVYWRAIVSGGPNCQISVPAGQRYEQLGRSPTWGNRIFSAN